MFNVIIYLVAINLLQASMLADSFLSKLSNDNSVSIKYNNNGFVSYVYSDGMGETNAEWILSNHANIFGVDNINEDLKLISHHLSKKGTSHLKYQQIHKGIPVFGRFIIFHFNINGELSSITNDFIPYVSFDNNHAYQINRFNEQLFNQPDIILSNYKQIIYTYDSDPIQAHMIDASTLSSSNRYIIDANSGLIVKIFPLIHTESIIGEGENVLGEWVDDLHLYEGNDFETMPSDLVTPDFICQEYCYDYGDCDGGNYSDCILSYSQGECPEHFLEDCNGDCFHSWYMQFPGVGNGVCNDPWINISIESLETNNVNMVDVSNPSAGNIYTLNSYGNFYEDLSYVGSDSNIFDSDDISLSHEAGVSAHSYQRNTTDYFWDFHGYSGMDGIGKRIVSIVNYGPGGFIGLNNAFYNAGLQSLNYGPGSGSAYRPFSAAQDIVTHEFSHGFTAHTSGLVYEYQPGAINEHISDAFGYFVEAEYQNGGDWLEGEDVHTDGTASRSFINPPIYGQPDHMDHNYYYTGTGDYGGVHTNSGIANKVLYLTVEGGEHYGIDVPPFNEDINESRIKASNIWFEWNAYYLSPFDGFIEASSKMILVCNDLYPNDDGCFESVYRAWKSVGIDVFDPYIDMVDVLYFIIDGSDPAINPGETYSLDIQLYNFSESNIANNVYGSIVCNTNMVTFYNNQSAFNSMEPGEASSTINLFNFYVNENISLGDPDCNLIVTATNQLDEYYQYSFSVPINISLDQWGYPIYFGTQIKGAPLVIDIDNDNFPEVITGNYSGGVHIFGQFGTELGYFDTGNQIYKTMRLP